MITLTQLVLRPLNLEGDKKDVFIRVKVDFLVLQKLKFEGAKIAVLLAPKSIFFFTFLFFVGSRF